MKVIVKDFQSIEDVKLDVKGFTLLVGESSQGKSATLRALQSALTNRFRAGQVRNGTSCASIGVKFDEGNVVRVTRPVRGSVTMSLDGVDYSKLGRSVPKAIGEVVNMGDVEGDGVDYNLNFHNQFEKPLLLEFSQSKVMELLSASEALDDLGIAKDGLSERRTELRGSFGSLNSLLSSVKEDLSTVCGQISKYDAAVSELRSLLDRGTELRASVEGITSMRDEVVEYNRLLSRTAFLREVLSMMSELGAAADGLQSDITLMEELRQEVKDVTEFGAKRSRLVGIKDICGQIVSLDSDKRLLDDILRCGNDIKGLIDQKFMMSNRIEELKRFVVDGICPICGNKITEDE